MHICNHVRVITAAVICGLLAMIPISSAYAAMPDAGTYATLRALNLVDSSTPSNQLKALNTDAATISDAQAVRVTPVNIETQSTPTVTITPTLPFTPQGVSNLPAAPTDLEQLFWPGSIGGALEWKDNSTNETKFVIMEKAVGESEFKQVAEVPADKTRYDMKLTEGYKAEYKVAAVNDAGTSAYSNSVTVTIIPKAPENIRIENGSAAFDAIRLYWSYSGKNIDSFVVHVVKESSTIDEKFVLPSDVDYSQSPFYYKNGKAGDKITFYVRAHNAAGESMAQTKIEYEILPTPAGFNPGAWPESPYFNLQWEDKAKDEIAYIVRIVGKHQDAIKELKEIKLPANSTIYKTELDLGEGWYMMVFAYKNDHAMSLPSTLYWTAAGESAPKAPSDLTTSGTVSPGAVFLKWKDNSPNDSKFIVERKMLTESEFKQIAEVKKFGVFNPTYSDTGIEPGMLYDYRVKATNKWGDSAYTQVVQGSGVPSSSYPESVWGLKANWQADGNVLLQWKHTGTKVSYYLIERKVQGGDYTPLMGVGVATSGDKTNIAVSDNVSLDKSKVYYYKVSTVNGTYQAPSCPEVQVSSGAAVNPLLINGTGRFKQIVLKNLDALIQIKPDTANAALPAPTAQDGSVQPLASAAGRVAVLSMGSAKMLVDGQQQDIDQGRQTSPMLTASGRTLVPIRAIIETMGGKLDWDQQAQRATLTLGDKSVDLFIGQKDAKVSGVSVAMEEAPQIINGRTMLPLRFVGENLGLGVKWDAAAKSITISN